MNLIFIINIPNEIIIINNPKSKYNPFNNVNLDIPSPIYYYNPKSIILIINEIINILILIINNYKQMKL